MRKLRSHITPPPAHARPVTNFTRRGEKPQPREWGASPDGFSGFHRPYLVRVGFECRFECLDCTGESCDEFVRAWRLGCDERGVCVADLEGVDFLAGDVDRDVDGEVADRERLVADLGAER